MDEGPPGVVLTRAPGRAAAGEAGYALDSSAGHLLRRAHQRYQAVFQDCAAGLGLTGPQFAALLRIAERGRVTQNLLGRLAAMDSATVQGVVRRLEARGLVHGARDPLDRRARVLTITPHGAQVLRVAMEAGRRANEALLAPLSEGERRQFLALLQRLAATGG
jgi:DNA-binding MarR family transcriptional regulator